MGLVPPAASGTNRPMPATEVLTPPVACAARLRSSASTGSTRSSGATSAWEPDTSARGHLAFPDLTFLHLLMGSRSLAELDAFYADCIVAHRQRGALAEVLFPKQPSNLWFTF